MTVQRRKVTLWVTNRLDKDQTKEDAMRALEGVGMGVDAMSVEKVGRHDDHGREEAADLHGKRAGAHA